VPGAVRPEFVQPRWRGGPLGGRTILLWCEQGMGDTIQMIRYAALHGRRIVRPCHEDDRQEGVAADPAVPNLLHEGNRIAVGKIRVQHEEVGHRRQHGVAEREEARDGPNVW
jgi:hypothetical protein